MDYDIQTVHKISIITISLKSRGLGAAAHKLKTKSITITVHIFNHYSANFENLK